MAKSGAYTSFGDQKQGGDTLPPREPICRESEIG